MTNLKSEFEKINYLSEGEHSLEEVLKLAGLAEEEDECQTCKNADLTGIEEWTCPECGATFLPEKTRPNEWELI